MADTHVTLVGNLTDDPELRFTPGGAAVANFRLAVTPRVKDGDGWRDGEPSFFPVTVWRQLAENVAESLSKGDRVMVAGQLRQRTCETPERDKRSTVEVQADEVGPSLRWATARPEKSRTATKASAGAGAPANTKDGAKAGGWGDDEPPF